MLTKFYSDDQFLGEPIYATLSRGLIMSRVVNIIAENIQDLEAIELSDNKIYSLNELSELTSRAPNVKILYLANNLVSYCK